MALLQMRDLPDELYEKLKIRARAERRSITQQAVVILEETLSEDHNKARRKHALEKLHDIRAEFKKPADLVHMLRDDRER